MFHIISDSNLGHMDWAPEQHKIDPKTKYIILAGNISFSSSKRLMLYGETLAKMYKDSAVILNVGVLEGYKGLFDRIEHGIELHINDFKKSPENMYHPKGQCIGDYDFYCAIGWPTIINDHNLNDAFITKNLYKALDQEFYIDNVLMTKFYPRCFTLKDINELVAKEQKKITAWLNNDQGKQKVLISSFSDWSTSLIGESTYTVFKDLDLSKVIWICSGDCDFVGPYRDTRVISLPGKDRTRYINEDTMDLIA